MSAITQQTDWEVELYETDLPGFDEGEAYALLAGLSVPTTPLVAAANAGHTGAMVALVPSDEDLKRLAVEGGEDADQLHLTLAFLGEADKINRSARGNIYKISKRYAKKPVTAEAFSINAFNPGKTSEGKDTCVVLGVGNSGGDELQNVRSNVVSALNGLGGFEMPEQHTPWIPHVTLAYTDDLTKIAEWADRVGPITFDKLRVAFGDEVEDFPLAEEVTVAAAFKYNEHQKRSGKTGQWVKVGDAGESVNARAQRLETTLHDARESATHLTHTKKGAWSPERDAIHREIVDEFFKRAENVPSEGRAILTGGNSGAGKTTVLTNQAGVDFSKYLKIDPDEVKEELARRGLIPEVPGDFSPMERSTLVHRESIRIADMLADKAIKARKNVIWDGTMANPDLVRRRVKKMTKSDYGDIQGIFIDVSDDVSRQRNASRYRKGIERWKNGQGFGSRYVPQSVQDTMTSADTRSGFKQLRPSFHNWTVYDNNGETAKLVASKGDKK